LPAERGGFPGLDQSAKFRVLDCSCPLYRELPCLFDNGLLAVVQLVFAEKYLAADEGG